MVKIGHQALQSWFYQILSQYVHMAESALCSYAEVPSSTLAVIETEIDT